MIGLMPVSIVTSNHRERHQVGGRNGRLECSFKSFGGVNLAGHI